MGTRGRKSAASLEVVRPVTLVERPEAPVDLTDEQAGEWSAIVDSLPADWFGRESHGMLAQYCRHVIASRRISQLIQAEENGPDLDIGQYDMLLKMQEREGRALSSLATRLRISKQATATEKTPKKAKVARPWEG